MADNNGVNYDQTQQVKLKKVNPGEKNGAVKVMQEEFTFAAELGIGDTILGLSLPKGAKILSAKMVAPAGFTAGSFELGNKASTDKDGVAISEDSNGLISAVNMSAAAQGSMDAASPLWLKKLGSEMQIFATATVATTAAIGLSLLFRVEYVVD